MEKAAVFDETYDSYMEQVAGLDLGALQQVLGYEMESGQALIPMYNRLLRIGPEGIQDHKGCKPDLSICVVLCKYLLMAPEQPPEAGGLATFKDFPDAAPLIHFFGNSIEGKIARQFSGRAAALEEACRQLRAERYSADLAYQVKFRFAGLPRVPVILLFNDAEEGFAAQCTLLFQQSVRSYLDMESLAMLGGILVGLLQRFADLN